MSRADSHADLTGGVTETALSLAVKSNFREGAKTLVEKDGVRLDPATIKHFENCYTREGMVFFCELLRLELGMPELSLGQALVVSLLELNSETRFSFFRHNLRYFFLLLGDVRQLDNIFDISGVLPCLTDQISFIILKRVPLSERESCLLKANPLSLKQIFAVLSEVLTEDQVVEIFSGVYVAWCNSVTFDQPKNFEAEKINSFSYQEIRDLICQGRFDIKAWQVINRAWEVMDGSGRSGYLTRCEYLALQSSNLDRNSLDRFIGAALGLEFGASSYVSDLGFLVKEVKFPEQAGRFPIEKPEERDDIPTADKLWERMMLASASSLSSSHSSPRFLGGATVSVSAGAPAGGVVEGSVRPPTLS